MKDCGGVRAQGITILCKYESIFVIDVLSRQVTVFDDS